LIFKGGAGFRRCDFQCAGRLDARVSRRVRGFQVPGWGQRAGWSGQGGEGPEAGEDLGEQVGLPSRCGQQLVPSLRRGSGYEQASAKLHCIESDEVAVAFGPPA